MHNCTIAHYSELTNLFGFYSCCVLLAKTQVSLAHDNHKHVTHITQPNT